MNICFICKYPPIEGGVSMHGYWGARGLAERGHKVFVVTNANEIEETFRIRLSAEDLREGGEYARSFPESGGSVEVHSTEPPDRSRLYYIPMGNPTVTRLATIATDLIRKHDCKVIYSYYLEPYGMAAHLASSWTGVPYAFKHAGSDLNRLMPLDELKTAYTEVLARANRIVTRGPSRKQLMAYGLPEERLDSRVGFGLPEHCFHPGAAPLNLNALLAELAAAQPEEERAAGRYAPIDERLPVIGIYGKLGQYKGSFDLVHAMAKVVHAGLPFNLVALSRGWQERVFFRHVEEAGLSKYVRVLPFIPHWRIPSFIRACTAVAFLERDFPIAAHTPTIPTEIIQTGRCALVSEEVIRKQMFRHKVRDRQNLIVVPDPKDHDGLANCLRFALESPERAAEIGRRGRDDLSGGHGYKDYIDGLESLLTEVAAEGPAPRMLVGAPSAPQPPSGIDAIAALFPNTFALLHADIKPRVQAAVEAVDATGADRAEIAAKFGAALEAALAEAVPEEPSAIRDICRYERMVHAWSRMSEPGPKRTPRAVRFSASEIGSLVPTLSGGWEIASFSCDVEAIVEAIVRKEKVPVQKEDVRVLFRLGSPPLRLNIATETLIRLIAETGGAASMEVLFNLLAEIFDAVTAEARSRLEASCLSVLEGLYWEGFIDFQAAEGQASAEAA